MFSGTPSSAQGNKKNNEITIVTTYELFPVFKANKRESSKTASFPRAYVKTYTLI